MRNTIKFIAAAALLAASFAVFASGQHSGGHAAASIGQPGVSTAVSRTIAIQMEDTMRFTPSEVKVAQGETIRFVVTNAGQLRHEFNLGTDADLKAHAEQMKKFPEMEHDEPNLVSLAPGKTGEVIWHFTKAGKVSFACLHVGHYDAGMKGQVLVAKTAAVPAVEAPTAPKAGSGVVGSGADMAADWARGEVRKVDKAALKITLKHGDIKSLDMPPMTMVFRVADTALLDSVKVGDQVQFSVERRAGAIVVTQLKALP
ncbi:MAG: hypothetical protein CFE44_22120 [Burkholderiales bacterium PBB4]|nr:MAG: hypothetical protein CFE44_22120 [Burkholderiales bacterium PBB4]